MKSPKIYPNSKPSSLPVVVLFLFCLAAVLAGASFVAASLVHNPQIHRISADSRPTAGDLNPDDRLAQGMFLVAGRRLLDPNFRQTVVLLIRYGPDGAMGLVVNRPAAVKLSAVMPEIKELEQSKESLYIGGPVEPAKMLLLVKAAKVPEESVHVFEDIYISSSRSELQRLIKSTDKNEKFRMYAGYSGWGAGQLESERERGDWHLLKADAATLFDRKSAEIWPALIHRVTVNWVRL